MTTTITCEHNSRTGEGGTHYVCDECGDARPMTEREKDWARQDIPKCVRCGHSERFGGPLDKRTGLFNNPYLIHEGCKGVAI